MVLISQDYFTAAEFREVTGDEDTPQRRYETTDIMETQEEVLEALESWARTAWKSRTTTQTDLLKVGYMPTRYIPVTAVSSFSLSGTVQTADQYVIELASGVIRFGDWSYGMPQLWPNQMGVIAYTYGFTAVPRLVKNACIKATKSLLDEEEGRGKIPPNTRRYSTERTDFELEVRDDIEPWPWDQMQSARMRSYWGRRRPRTLISV